MKNNTITIIDYNLGNLRSLINAFDFLNIDIIITNDIDIIKKSKKILLPGVGNYKQAITNLHNLNLFNVIKDKVQIDKVPILGICLGMQLLTDSGEEGGFEEGLGLIPGKIILMKPKNNLLIPHYGWSNLNYINNKSKLLSKITDKLDFYFVHSYSFIGDKKYISSTYEYDQNITSSIENKHIFGVQFHPEKSKQQGLNILLNFWRYDND